MIKLLSVTAYLMSSHCLSKCIPFI